MLQSVELRDDDTQHGEGERSSQVTKKRAFICYQGTLCQWSW